MSWLILDESSVFKGIGNQAWSRISCTEMVEDLTLSDCFFNPATVSTLHEAIVNADLIR